MKYTDVKAVGRYVVLKAEKAEEPKEVVTDSGLVLPGASAVKETGHNVNLQRGKVRIKPPKVYSIGPKVNKEELGLEIGDEVVCNDYDIHSFTSDLEDGKEDAVIWIVCKDDSIQCVIKTEK